MSYKPHFSRFLNAAPGRLHFAAHSHHLWPDVTFDAQQQCWNDAARLADQKWEKIFGDIIPAAQQHVARVLNLGSPNGIAFGPNTHSFLMRLLSCLPAGKAARILTTDGEFHSFTRQVRRLEQEALAIVTRIPSEPFATFEDRFATAAGRGAHDLVYFSHVFYNSGYAVSDLSSLISAVSDDKTLVVVDGYHGFLALPTDLSPLERRAFYLAGGYKYAMAGEGASFLYAPPGYAPRPRNTGWFAGFGALERSDEGAVAYGEDGTRFLGATFDPTGIYRLSAVLAWLDELGLSVARIHEHAHTLQQEFIDRLAALRLAALHPGQLVVSLEEPSRGHFLTFRTPAAGEIHRRLLDADIITDYRGDRLRIGFGLYHDAEDVARLCDRLEKILA